ncbi:hypothetical protein WJX72_011116 [[Myrmecia] bisecta]|uniref:Uncharacterized protein n=1 Tax=[Myrmecia] bisecta TaxID=41462 RepID=A0AAW1PU82_9CHLO
MPLATQVLSKWPATAAHSVCTRERPRSAAAKNTVRGSIRHPVRQQRRCRIPLAALRGTAPVVDIPDQEAALPCLRDCHHFINLTNGIEALPVFAELELPYSFVRIQSTMCEQQRFEHLINEVDANLLMHLALGHCCLVWDYGSRNKKQGASRAQWYGIEFIRHVLNRVWWHNMTSEVYLRGYRVTPVFDQHINAFHNSTRKRVKYFRQYIPPCRTGPRLYSVYRATTHDDDANFYRELVRQSHTGPSRALPMAGDRRSFPEQHALLAGPLQDSVEQLGFKLFLRNKISRST